MAERLTERSCAEFAADLAAKEPVPGGGGAAALSGALAAALCSMVGNFTTGKKTYAAVEDDIQRMLAKAEDLRLRLIELVEEDAKYFEPLSRAYRIPKDDPQREAVLEACLKEAAAAPFEIFILSCGCIDLLDAFSRKGSKMVLSDAACGAAFARAALEGAAVNVKVNTKWMKNRPHADALDRSIDGALEEYRQKAGEIIERVWQTF